MKKYALLLLSLGACTGKFIRPTDPALKVEATPDRLARGEYLVNSVAACGVCHSGRDSGDGMMAFLDGESTTKYLGGGNYLSMPEMGASFWIPNLTSDPETGLGNWSDDEIMRAIRDGVNKDGKLMFPMMPFGRFQSMSDEDVQAVVAYLRTIPKVKLEKPRKPVEVSFPGNVFLFGLGVAHHEPAKSVKAPDKGDKVKYGEYVARLGQCADCHSSNMDGPRPEGDPMWMAGMVGDVADPFVEKMGVGKVYCRNLTPDDETGLGKYTAEQIKSALRTSTRLDGKKMAPPMSIMVSHFSTMTDEDLDALTAYLKSLKPAKNKVHERELSPEWKKKLGEEAPVASSGG